MTGAGGCASWKLEMRMAIGAVAARQLPGAPGAEPCDAAEAE